MGNTHRKRNAHDNVLELVHGKPLIFGKNRDKGIRMRGLELEVVTLGNGITESDLLIHNDSDPNPLYAFALSRMDTMEGFPTPIGVLRGIEGIPRYEDLINQQIQDVQAKRGKGDLGKLLRAGDTWEVRA